VLDVLYASRRNDSAPARPEPEVEPEAKAKATPKAKAAPKPKVKAPRKKPPAAAGREGAFPAASWPSEVVYLPTPAPAGDDDGPKWTGYTLERPHPHLSTVEPLADEA
jgi:hypothetical protein